MKRTLNLTILTLTAVALGSSAAHAGVQGKCYAGRLLCVGDPSDTGVFNYDGFVHRTRVNHFCFDPGEDNPDEGRLNISALGFGFAGLRWAQRDFGLVALVDFDPQFQIFANFPFTHLIQVGDRAFAFGFVNGVFCFFFGEEIPDPRLS